jgi:hypothetical protein
MLFLAARNVLKNVPRYFDFPLVDRGDKIQYLLP